MFVQRVAMCTKKTIVDRFGNERVVSGDPVEIDTPVSIQQQSSMETTGGSRSILRVTDESVILTRPGHLIDGVEPSTEFFIDGERWQVQGTPIVYEIPLKHMEIVIRKVQG